MDYRSLPYRSIPYQGLSCVSHALLHVLQDNPTKFAFKRIDRVFMTLGGGSLKVDKTGHYGININQVIEFYSLMGLVWSDKLPCVLPSRCILLLETPKKLRKKFIGRYHVVAVKDGVVHDFWKSTEVDYSVIGLFTRIV